MSIGKQQPTLSTEEEQALIDFYRLCERISNDQFYKSPEARGPYKWLEDGQIVTEVPFDERSFMAFLMEFRKLVLNNEHTNFRRIINICAKHSGDEDRQSIKKLRERITAVETGVITTTLQLSGGTKQLTHKEIFDNVINSRYFHTDLARQEVNGHLLELPNKSLGIVVTYSLEISALAINTAAIIRDLGWIKL